MGAGIGLLLPRENGILGTGYGKKCQNGNGINIFEHWEVGFGKNMGWEMGFEPPLPFSCRYAFEE